MANLAALKRGSSKDLLAKLQSTIATTDTKKSFEKDTRMWSPAIDVAGNGQAVVRFLPGRTEDSSEYVSVYNHGFQIGSKWFIANCPTTMKLPCPVCESNSEYWARGTESDKAIASKRSRKLSYFANVLVLKDPANPSNEGQVRIFRFGKKIFDKLKEAICPDPMEGTDPISPFDFFEGANFVIKISTVAGYNNYDKSKFTSKSELFDGDLKKLEAVISQVYDIDAFIDPKEFMSYEDMKKKFDNVVGNKSTQGEMSVDAFETAAKAPPKQVGKEAVSQPDDSDDLEFFRKLAAS